MEVAESEIQHTNLLPRYFATPPVKFVAMSICTLGLYEIYWSYKNWKLIRNYDGSNIMPFWRAVFYPFWHYALLTKLNEALDSEALSSALYRGALTVSLWCFLATGSLSDPYWLWSFLSVLAFLPALLEMRASRPTNVVHERTKGFRPINLIAYVLGGPLLAFAGLSSIGFIPSTAVVAGDALWDRDIEYLLEAEILAPEERIIYFYSGGIWSIAADGQFLSSDYVTSYYQDPETGETYVDFADFSQIKDIVVSWSKTSLESTVVTIRTTDDYEFELWLSNEGGGDRKFVSRMREIWRRHKSLE